MTADAPRRPPRLPRTPCRTPAQLPRREAGSSPPASRGETRRTEGERYGRDGKRHPSRSSRPTTDAANIGRLETRGDDTSEVTRVRNHRVPSSPWLCLPRRTRRWSSRTRSPPSRPSTRVARCDGCRGVVRKKAVYNRTRVDQSYEYQSQINVQNQRNFVSSETNRGVTAGNGTASPPHRAAPEANVGTETRSLRRRRLARAVAGARRDVVRAEERGVGRHARARCRCR